MTACPEILSAIVVGRDELIGDSTSTASGAVVNLSCNPGYKLDGESKVTCTNGKWSPGVPKCVIDDGKDDSGLSDEMVVTIACVVGGGMFFLILSSLLILFIKKRRQQKLKERNASELERNQNTINPVAQVGGTLPAPIIQPPTYEAQPTAAATLPLPTNNPVTNQYSDMNTELQTRSLPHIPMNTLGLQDVIQYGTASTSGTNQLSTQPASTGNEDMDFIKTITTLLVGLTNIWQRKQEKELMDNNGNVNNTTTPSPYPDQPRFGRNLRVNTGVSISNMPENRGFRHLGEQRNSRIEQWDEEAETDLILNNAVWYGREHYHHDSY